MIVEQDDIDRPALQSLKKDFSRSDHGCVHRAPGKKGFPDQHLFCVKAHQHKFFLLAVAHVLHKIIGDILRTVEGQRLFIQPPLPDTPGKLSYTEELHPFDPSDPFYGDQVVQRQMHKPHQPLFGIAGGKHTFR